ncbi:dolichol-P-mannose synthesis [Puccinia graminis f. sp. tritici]|uniref:dolichyl-phosphate beta-D-mannosyltransferase n=1 Tax=Puccinia graminis f. sp. tritici TaxID=56615 RepID=A0A5B0QZY8_PUCGR|nr:dolichol-P-mannose synthesis [Puccinia graminis f. sp. tritici]
MKEVLERVMSGKLITSCSGNLDKYSVILPTYNERRNLPIMIWLLARTFDQHQIDWEVIVVDDNSPDGTLEVAEQLQRLYGPHRIVRPPPSIYKAQDHPPNP